MFFESVRPDQAVGGNVAGFGGIDALEPSLVLAPPNIAAASDVQTIAVKDRHAVEIAWALLTIAQVFVNVGFRGRWIEIELKDLL